MLLCIPKGCWLSTDLKFVFLYVEVGNAEAALPEATGAIPGRKLRTARGKLRFVILISDLCPSLARCREKSYLQTVAKNIYHSIEALLLQRKDTFGCLNMHCHKIE